MWNFISKILGMNLADVSNTPVVGPNPAQPASVDVFGGQEYGGMASAAARKAEPHIGDYIENAVKNYARNKIGKKIAGRLDTAADVANAFGDENRTEAGGKIQEISDWFAGDERKKREQAKRMRGLYAY